MYNQLNDVVQESGIWEGDRKFSHAFLLSPSVFQLSDSKRVELINLGYRLNDCLLGLSYIAANVADTIFSSEPWPLVRRVFSTGVPKNYLELQGMFPKNIPRLLKVDFMLSTSGQLKIAEVDGHNKHGLGYSTLARRFHERLYPESITLPGVVNLVAREAQRLGFTKLKLLYADQERFYIPEFEIAQKEFERFGIECELIGEYESFEPTGLFLDLPFLYHNIGIYEQLIAGYKQGTVKFIIPPKPFLGSKAVLALLRNDTHDVQLEGLLRSFINPRTLEYVRSFIPETWLIGKKAAGRENLRLYLRSKRYVLKEAISSGMKGTVFSDDPTFDSTLSVACSTQMNWILQEEVENMPQQFSWYEAGTGTLHSSCDWFMRVTAQYVSSQLADVVITARREKAVHGAKDCLQLGTILV